MHQNQYLDYYVCRRFLRLHTSCRRFLAISTTCVTTSVVYQAFQLQLEVGLSCFFVLRRNSNHIVVVYENFYFAVPQQGCANTQQGYANTLSRSKGTRKFAFLFSENLAIKVPIASKEIRLNKFPSAFLLNVIAQDVVHSRSIAVVYLQLYIMYMYEIHFRMILRSPTLYTEHLIRCRLLICARQIFVAWQICCRLTPVLLALLGRQCISLINFVGLRCFAFWSTKVRINSYRPQKWELTT